MEVDQACCVEVNGVAGAWREFCFNPLKDEAQTALFKAPVRTAL